MGAPALPHSIIEIRSDVSAGPAQPARLALHGGNLIKRLRTMATDFTVTKFSTSCSFMLISGHGQWRWNSQLMYHYPLYLVG